MPSIAEANQMLVQAGCNPRVSGADRQRCMMALAAVNECPKAHREAVAAPVAAHTQQAAPDMLESTTKLLASLPQGERGLAVVAEPAPSLVAALDSSIPAPLCAQLDAGAESRTAEAQQREFLARRFAT
jgi:hypothetical protein